jgi:pre-rRNA-processing protein TSR2
LHMWPALTLAVQNNWSDDNAEEVRDWFAGAIVELFPDFSDVAKKKPNTLEEPDISDVESRLIQIMEDEYQVGVDDDSSLDVAQQIMAMRVVCSKGQFQEVDDLRNKWLAGRGKKVVMKQAPDADQDTDWETDGDDEDDNDVDMEDAPPLVSVPKEKPAPEIDEDGFTKVTKKKR